MAEIVLAVLVACHRMMPTIMHQGDVPLTLLQDPPPSRAR